MSRTEPPTLTGHFLIAMPGLAEPPFSRGVALLCQHSEEGAVGLLVNQLSHYRFGDVLAQMKLECSDPELADAPVLIGGPVQQERGFVVHASPGTWESTLQVSEDLYITTSRDVLGAIGRGEGPQKFFVALGYAGWAAGQLEHEILENSWLNTPVNGPILFDTPPANRWQAATRLLGVDVTQLAGDAGHS